MEPSNHTKLMNFIIGMCKKHSDWITTLSDLGYKPEVIEQRIRTSTDEAVKPDVIATSNKLVHSLVFDCKGGITVDQDQMQRYSTLTENDLLRWVSPFTAIGFRFDICISDVDEYHSAIIPTTNGFPILTFGRDTLTKTRDFKESRINAAFRNPISLDGKVPTLMYYPFCEDDKTPYIALFVIRGLVSLAIKQSRGGPSIYNNNLISKDELLKFIFNPIFDALSDEHKGRLKDKINEVVQWIMSKEEMSQPLGIIEQQAGYRINRPLEKLLEESNNLIKFLETQRALTEFPH